MGQGSEGERIARQELSGFSRRLRGWSQGVRAGNRELQTLRCHHRPLTGHQPHPHSFVFQKLFRSPGSVSGHTVDTPQVLAPSSRPQVARAIGGIARQPGRQWGWGGDIAFIMETAARSASPSKSPGNTPLRVRVAPLLLSALEAVVKGAFSRRFAVSQILLMGAYNPAGAPSRMMRMRLAAGLCWWGVPGERGSAGPEAEAVRPDGGRKGKRLGDGSIIASDKGAHS